MKNIDWKCHECGLPPYRHEGGGLGKIVRTPDGKSCSGYKNTPQVIALLRTGQH